MIFLENTAPTLPKEGVFVLVGIALLNAVVPHECDRGLGRKRADTGIPQRKGNVRSAGFRCHINESRTVCSSDDDRDLRIR